MRQIHVIELISKQRRELQRLVARPSETAGVVRRAHVVLWSADGIRRPDGLHPAVRLEGAPLREAEPEELPF